MTDHETLIENSNAFNRLRNAGVTTMAYDIDGIFVCCDLTPEGVMVRGFNKRHQCKRIVSWSVIGLSNIDPLADTIAVVRKMVLDAETQVDTANARC